MTGDVVSLSQARREQGRAAIGMIELQGGAVEAFHLALAAGDLRTARDALAALVASAPPDNAPLAALEWRGRQILTLATKLTRAEQGISE